MKLPQPVFDTEIINSRELTLVVGYHREAQRHCMSGYQQIICADRLTSSLQAGSYDAVYGIDGRFES